MAADYGRIHRLLKILMLIQGQEGWTAPRLAVECGTTERNIYRDLKMLEGAGVPYSFDKQTGGYTVRRDFFMPAVSLTFDESLALLALAEHVGGREQVPFTRPAARAISKIRCNLPRKVQEELAKLDERVAIQLAAANPPEATQDVYETMRAALANRTALLCRYESATGANGKPAKRNGQFVFKPYTLFFGQRAWYSIGHHSSHDEVRCLKLGRFTQCTPTQQTFTVPRDFSIKKHLGNAWRMIRGKPSFDIQLSFDSEFADTIADTHWHTTQEIEWNEDGSIGFRCTVDGLEEIVWWILSMGPHCKVIEPRELRDQVRRLAGQVLELYPPQ